MKVEEKKLSESTIELLIELDRADIETELQKAANRMSRNLKIPGFRPGAATYDTISRHLGGEAKIYEEAAQDIVSKTLGSELKTRDLPLAASPEVSIQKMVPGFGFSYKAIIALLPKIVLGDVKKIKLSKKETKVAGEEIEKAIGQLRESRVKEIAASGRGAQKGDRVIIDFSLSQEGVALEGSPAKDYALILGRGSFLPGFEENIIGLKAGQEKKFVLAFPENYLQKSLAGKKADVILTVKQILERVLPELNDEFAAGLGQYKSLIELKEAVGKNLLYEKERQEKERFELSVMEELLKISEIGELGEPLIKEETQKMISELEHGAQHDGLSFENYLQAIKKTREDLEKEFRPRAEHRLKIGLVAAEFGRAEKIKVEEAEVARELEIAKKAYARSPEIQARLDSGEYKNYIRNSLLSRKIFEVLAQKIQAV